MKTPEEISAEAYRRHPLDHTVDDPFGETGEAQSNPYGYEETARLAFIAGGAYALEGETPTDDERDALANRLDRKYKLFEKLYADHEHETMVLLRDAVAMLRRPSPPTEEQPVEVAALPPAAPTPRPGVLHIAAEVGGVLCGAARVTHVTDGPRYADCSACREAATRVGGEG